MSRYESGRDRVMRLVIGLVAVAVICFVAIHGMSDAQDRRRDRIESEGREAGADGMPPTACPYPDGLDHSAWKRGWQAGFRSRK